MNNNNNNNNRAFRGVWIPEKTWLSKKLSVTEKILLTEIDSLSNNPQGCFASNQYLGDFLGLTKESVSNMVSKLAKKGFITVKLIYKENSKEIMKRFIKINDKCEQSQDVTEYIDSTHNKMGTPSNSKNDIINQNNIDTPTHKNVVTYPQKNGEPPHKNMVDTNTVTNTFNNTITTTSKSSSENEKKESRNSSSNFIELLFLKKKDYSELNSATRLNIIKAHPNLEEAQFKKIYDLSVLEIKNGYGNEFNAVLYKGLKDEWNFDHKVEINAANIVLEPEKAEWLRCFSGIKSSPELYGYVKKSIVKIPMETLRANKNKIGMMPTYDLKKHIASLVRASLQK